MSSESSNITSCPVSSDSTNNCSDSSSNIVRQVLYEPTEYVQRARVTKTAPPPPAYNPMQFVAVKPVRLFKSPEQQQKEIEEISKKSNLESKREDAEEWQSNLDNWKCSRRKRVEHIIDRVVEVKKLELEDHDRNIRKSKTFSEMMEERGARRKIPVPIYQDNDGNDFSDFGINTSSASGKSSLSEDFDVSTTDYTDKKTSNQLNKDNEKYMPKSIKVEDITETASSNVEEYAYEEAIENYKSRVKEVANTISSIEVSSKTEPNLEDSFISIDINSNDTGYNAPLKSNDLPKVNIAKRRELFELFEKEKEATGEKPKNPVAESVQKKNIKQRMLCFETEEMKNKEACHKILDIDKNIPSLKGRFLILERKVNRELMQKPNQVDVQVSHSLKERLSTLQSCIDSSNYAKVNCNNEKRVDILKNDKEQINIDNENIITKNIFVSPLHENKNQINTDLEDSKAQTRDVSCYVSQAEKRIKQQFDEVEPPNCNNHILHKRTQNVNTTSPTKYEEAKKLHEDTHTQPYLSMPDLIQHNSIAAEEQICDQQDENVVQALEIAFHEIDNESSMKTNSCIMKAQMPKIVKDFNELEAEISSFYSSIDNNPCKNSETFLNINKYEKPSEHTPESYDPHKNEDKKNHTVSNFEKEFLHQTLNQEPYYQVPVTKPIPFYENIHIRGPPNEKPPPPPIEEMQREQNKNFHTENIHFSKDVSCQSISVKCSKKNMMNKRYSFLDFEKPKNGVLPNSSIMCKFLEDERKLQRQLLKKGFSDNSDTGESRDSGVSENHSRQSSGPYSVEEHHDITMKSPNMNVQLKTLDENIRIKNMETQEQKIVHGDNINNDVTYRQQAYIINTDYRKSMPELPMTITQQDLNAPAKPLRSRIYQESSNAYGLHLHKAIDTMNTNNWPLSTTYGRTDLTQTNKPVGSKDMNDNSNIYANISKDMYSFDTFGFTNNMVQQLNTKKDYKDSLTPVELPIDNNDNFDPWGRGNDYRPHNNSESQKKYYNHWLIQEAEQRRLDQQQEANNNSKKPLPDSIIQTITQRVHNMGIGERKRYTQVPRNLYASNSDLPILNQRDSCERALSVSGKKKCTHCGIELGRGAAMIIESLQLFYHIDCFICFVCHIPLGDGLGGTDVRVRNSKLHCQNCYSNDEGVKFSCV